MRIGGSLRSTVIIFVDGIRNGRLYGRFHHLSQAEKQDFRSLEELILLCDAQMDRLGGPQAYMRRRTWEDSVPLQTELKNAESDDCTGSCTVMITDCPGCLASFVVHVKVRQNASWQGEVRWLDRDRRVEFRSVLELMELLWAACRAPATPVVELGALELETAAVSD